MDSKVEARIKPDAKPSHCCFRLDHPVPVSDEWQTASFLAREVHHFCLVDIKGEALVSSPFFHRLRIRFGNAGKLEGSTAGYPSSNLHDNAFGKITILCLRTLRLDATLLCIDMAVLVDCAGDFARPEACRACSSPKDGVVQSLDYVTYKTGTNLPVTLRT